MKLKMSRRTSVHIVLYLISVAAISVVVHEAAHIIAACVLGVPFAELKLGFYGINPSVTLPAWFTGTPRLIVYYAGGLVPGLILLFMYLFYWMRRYRRQPAILSWSLGLVTIVLAAMQLAIAYMEGHYHEAYINNAGSLFSPTNILVCGFMVAAFFLHSALSPRTRMRKANQPVEDTAPEIHRS